MLTGKVFAFGKTINVPSNSNFGYHSISLGLQTMGKIISLKLSEVSYLRNIFCIHAKNAFDELKRMRYSIFLMILIKEKNQ